VAVRIIDMVMRICFVINLVLGLLFWTNNALGLRNIHMLVGIILVACVWFLGLAQGTRKGGSIGLIFGTFLIGLLLAVVGMVQTGISLSPHWIIQVIHLLLAIAAIGLGEASYGRFRRASAATPAAA
jgi:hypothetical protein